MNIQPDNIYFGDCLELLPYIPDETIDIVLTDPPYLYLKHKLDVSFDEQNCFNEVKRVLKKDGFIVLFGRGTSFYRWNIILADLGFAFKEEIIWNKIQGTSALLPIQRVHETVSIHTKGNGHINKVCVPFMEKHKYSENVLPSILSKLKSIEKVLQNENTLKQVQADLIKYGKVNHTFSDEEQKSGLTNRGILRNRINDMSCVNQIIKGWKEKSIMQINRENSKNAIHPTQKPIRLLERLLALTSMPGNIVLDPFAGSCNTAKAALNSDCHYICMEKDEEYFNAAKESMKTFQIKQKNLF